VGGKLLKKRGENTRLKFPHRKGGKKGGRVVIFTGKQQKGSVEFWKGEKRAQIGEKGTERGERAEIKTMARTRPVRLRRPAAEGELFQGNYVDRPRFLPKKQSALDSGVGISRRLAGGRFKDYGVAGGGKKKSIECPSGGLRGQPPVYIFNKQKQRILGHQTPGAGFADLAGLAPTGGGLGLRQPVINQRKTNPVVSTSGGNEGKIWGSIRGGGILAKGKGRNKKQNWVGGEADI